MLKTFLTILVCIVSTKGFSQTVSISPVKTRVLYQWLDNPLQVVVENSSCKNLIVKAQKGKIKGKECEYIYTTNDTVFRDVIKVGILKNGKVKWISEQDFIVKKLYDPDVAIGSWIGKNDTVYKSALMAQVGLNLPLYDFGICSFTDNRRQVVTDYNVKVFRNSKVIFSEIVASNLLTEKFKSFISTQSLKNDTIVFENITGLLYQKEIRKLDQKFSLVLGD